MARKTGKSYEPTEPAIPPDYAIELLKEQLIFGEGLLARRPISKADFSEWRNTSSQYIAQAFGSDSPNVATFGVAGHVRAYFGVTEEHLEGLRAEAIERQLPILKSAIAILRSSVDLSQRQSQVPIQFADHISQIEFILSRFHLVALQLRLRHEGRMSLFISDEYDAQDLLHSLLCLFFNDIRPEEWTPSYAGGSSRMDFLLKPERTVIEVKKTRQTLLDREIGEQLIIDHAKYGNHPDCDTLFCLVYDPDFLLANPIGLEEDLSKQEGRPQVRALVVPSRV